MAIAVTAGALYFALIFALGFALGTVRVLILAPSLGTLISTLIELPVILGASWLACGWLVNAFRVPSRLTPRLIMGATAFGLLMIAEAGLSIAVFGETLSSHLAAYGSPDKALGLAGQILFAAFPLIRRRAH